MGTPFVKVTEVDGFADYTPWDGCCIFMKRDNASDDSITVHDLCPTEAQDAQRGHFRIVVEFWPEVKA